MLLPWERYLIYEIEALLGVCGRQSFNTQVFDHSTIQADIDIGIIPDIHYKPNYKAGEMPGTTLGDRPSVTLSFANNFWGKEDAGVGPLMERMHGAKNTGDELKSFYATRAQIEEEYAKKLLNLARKPLGAMEGGTLRMSLDVVRGEVESMGKQHQTVAQQMKSELDEPLARLHGRYEREAEDRTGRCG